LASSIPTTELGRETDSPFIHRPSIKEGEKGDHINHHHTSPILLTILQFYRGKKKGEGGKYSEINYNSMVFQPLSAFLSPARGKGGERRGKGNVQLLKVLENPRIIRGEKKERGRVEGVRILGLVLLVVLLVPYLVTEKKKKGRGEGKGSILARSPYCRVRWWAKKKKKERTAWGRHAEDRRVSRKRRKKRRGKVGRAAALCARLCSFPGAGG